MDPVDKHQRIQAKAEVLDQETPNPALEIEGQVSCTECDGELECIAGSANLYKCDDCGRTWEHVGMRGENHVWVCVFDPED